MRPEFQRTFNLMDEVGASDLYLASGSQPITVEDPIEFVHESQECLGNHREVGMHTKSFAAALRGALREDPDIILVGEMRDLETIQLVA